MDAPPAGQGRARASAAATSACGQRHQARRRGSRGSRSRRAGRARSPRARRRRRPSGAGCPRAPPPGGPGTARLLLKSTASTRSGRDHQPVDPAEDARAAELGQRGGHLDLGERDPGPKTKASSGAPSTAARLGEQLLGVGPGRQQRARRAAASRPPGGRAAARAAGAAPRPAPAPPPRPPPRLAGPGEHVRAAERGGRARPARRRRAAGPGAAPRAGPPASPARGRRRRGAACPASSATGRARRRPRRARSPAPRAGIGVADERVPAVLRPRRLRPGAADDQPAPRPGHRDVEQAHVLRAHLGPARGLGADERAAASRRRGTCQAGSPFASRRICGGLRPSGRAPVSGRMTTGASSPLAPCTVITRTWSAPSSTRRFTSTASRSIQARKPLRLGASTLLVGERLVDERVDAVLGLGPEPRHQLPPAVVARSGCAARARTGAGSRRGRAGRRRDRARRRASARRCGRAARRRACRPGRAPARRAPPR